MIDMRQVFERSTGRQEKYLIPLLSPTETRIGHMTLRVFSIPTVSKTTQTPQSLPASFNDCLAGVRTAEWHLAERKSGVLTQMGGDCSVRFSGKLSNHIWKLTRNP
jgi:hypothetical protein